MIVVAVGGGCGVTERLIEVEAMVFLMAINGCVGCFAVSGGSESSGLFSVYCYSRDDSGGSLCGKVGKCQWCQEIFVIKGGASPFFHF